MFVDPVILGGLLKRTYTEFDMLSFNNRLKLQKYIYLIQSMKLGLGYGFNFYLHGPYSTELAKDGFQIKNYSEIKPLSFDNQEAETKFNKFLEFFKPHKDDREWLEVSATYIYWKKQQVEEERIIEMINTKHPNYSIEKIKKIIQEFKETGDEIFSIN